VLEHEPTNYRVLIRLGQAYLALNRAADAAHALKQAIDLAPEKRVALMYYRDALEKLGRKQEAAAVLARLKQADSMTEGRRPQAGLIDYLRLPVADQRARFVANLRRNVDANPADPRWKIRLGKELLLDGKTAEAQELFRSLSTESNPEVLASSGRILLDYEQYELARQFLESAIHAAPSLSAARLDLAIALFHSRTPEAALAELERTPDVDQKGDYYLLRAQILDAQGKIEDAATALNLGIRAAPTRTSLYYQAAGFLLKHKLYHETLALLEQASRVLPDDRELLLAQVVTLNLLRRNMDSEKLLERIQTQWPEWERVYLLKGILLQIELRSAEARQTLETAIALGANTPEAYYYEALAIMHSAPQELNAAQNAITHALALTSQDPYIYLLAGKISLARKDYSTAVARLLDATRLQPTLIPAHYALRHAYSALGEKQKSQAEMETIQHIASETGASDESPFSMENLLFTVRPPG
jgi:tetratricopeptide (TPR) repeat protein